MHHPDRAAVLAILTAIVSHLAGINWLGWAGLAVSAGWLALGYARHRLERQRFTAVATRKAIPR